MVAWPEIHAVLEYDFEEISSSHALIAQLAEVVGNNRSLKAEVSFQGTTSLIWLSILYVAFVDE